MSGYRILTIDDDPDICMVLKAALGLEHTVETASDGMEGLQLLDTFAPDFIVTDINMPVMDGFETAAAIRQHPKFFDVPIFFLSAEKGSDVPQKSFEAGCNLFLRKPIDPMRLLKNIDYFLKESGIQPGSHQASPPPVAAPQVVDTGPVRVLAVDAKGDSNQRLKAFFSSNSLPSGPFEILWINDPHKALGNLARWQPDLVLYNTRNPGMDGIAFSQCLLLRKTVGHEIVFLASQFFNAEIEFSKNRLKRDVIDLTRKDGSLEKILSEAIATARNKLRPKSISLSQIEKEETEQQRQIQIARERKERERQTLAERYAGIQRFIDKEFS